LAVEWAAADVYDFARRERGQRLWDLLIAHAFLDLVDAPRLLPELLALLRPGGLFYFTINFDGVTILEPPVDPGFDEQVIALYHRTMDERGAGDSRSGRHLLWQLPAAGAELLAAGASDWVVVPSRGGYPADEAEFLRAILDFFENSLTGRPELDPARLAGWLARRRAQVEAGELIYMAHQMDVCGRVGE
jgi:SAM-dependent methyltransferase